ncbi:vacuole membrane protein 1 isoform X1 [Drosophila nasuta]|uniref:vacuole membrane protein 1 isoform X1 n=2 Tax=Drosophila nasuta TaxID=42062 RepID=UPI00295E45D5|nr:vacuole membrane protein 1 isoform X1 [Drosophila nasuta]
MLYKSEMRKRMSALGVASMATSLTIDSDVSPVSAADLERRSLVIWRRPWTTLKYSSLEACLLLFKLLVRLLDRRLLLGVVILIVFCSLPGPHEKYVRICRHNLGFALYWLGLGVLSSVGFGSGLHTFLLYLGPHVAAVTLAAYECQTLNFPMPPYPDQKICPKEGVYERHVPNVWQILTKVRTESLLWGVGTALGELPPYFMARAARLSGKCMEDRQEIAEHQRRSWKLGLFDRCKLFVERVVLRIGFFGILLCASVPNPLFDLAGVACGHFLVPFWKFFLATLIGKAIFKANIQLLIVVIAFNEDLVTRLINSLGRLPWFGHKLQAPIQKVLTSTKLRMHRKIKDDSSSGLGIVAHGFQILALLIVTYFIVSLLNALAQKHCQRMQDKEREERTQEIELLEHRSNDSDTQQVMEISDLL